VHSTRPLPPNSCRSRGLSILKRASFPAHNLENASASAVLNCFPPQSVRGQYLQFHSFDESYVSRLQSGDFRTQEHFSAYFSALIKIKLGSRLRSPEAIEDVRQETFARFFIALRDGKILQPDRLGSFVNSICNNVLLEHYRSGARNTPLDDEDENNFPALDSDLLGALGAKETANKVQEVLEQLPERDRRVLRAIFFEERDKDEVCREMGVTRDNLRLLLFRAKQKFKALYDNGADALGLARA
jgi:RNA polymerase sigma-70 factor (ECF subfamily)